MHVYTRIHKQKSRNQSVIVLVSCSVCVARASLHIYTYARVYVCVCAFYNTEIFTYKFNVENWIEIFFGHMQMNEN